MRVIERPSPNFGPRRGVDAPDLVVLHYTDMASAEAALRRLTDPASEVSAHYLVGADGLIWRLVEERARAWHAGTAHWGVMGDGGPAGDLAKDVNSRAIGIELAHPGHSSSVAGGARACAPFPQPQMDALTKLLASILGQWRIHPSGVLGHSDVAPGRKIDPGEKFDWGRLARAGLAAPLPRVMRLDSAAVARAAALAPEARRDRFAARLAAIGYGPWNEAALLDAFRRHWRPAAMGSLATERADALDLAVAEAIEGPSCD
ncbi:MAG: N-acetylmuramoyl-L-alanine amidase [Pseudomonadota bacterium]